MFLEVGLSSSVIIVLSRVWRAAHHLKAILLALFETRLTQTIVPSSKRLLPLREWLESSLQFEITGLSRYLG